MVAIAPAVLTNLSVQMVADGTPAFSAWMPSCTLHALQEPQSPMATTTASQLSVSCFNCSGSAGLEALGLRCHWIPAISYLFFSTSANSSSRTSAFCLLSSIMPTLAPAMVINLGAQLHEAVIHSVVGVPSV